MSSFRLGPLLLVLWCGSRLSGAFVVTHSIFPQRTAIPTVQRNHRAWQTCRTRVRIITRQFGRTDDDMPLLGNSEDFDLEATRRKLEALVSREASASSTEDDPASQGRTALSPQSNDKDLSDTIARTFFEIFFGPLLQPKEEKDKSKPKQHQTISIPSFSTPFYKFLHDGNRSLDVLNGNLRQSLTRKHQLPITALEIERRETEIGLLDKLADSDAVVDDLWSVWFHERGLAAAQQLQRVEEFMAYPAQWGQAEGLLEKLIDQHGSTWAEPINRLATLYYMQGRLLESEQLCRVVLSIKPWHFGALAGIVMVYSSLNKAHLAKQWAGRRLPPLPPSSQSHVQDPQELVQRSRQRHLWVHTATRQASQMLKQLIVERKQWWGPADFHQYQKSKIMEQIFLSGTSNDLGSDPLIRNDANAWQ